MYTQTNIHTYRDTAASVLSSRSDDMVPWTSARPGSGRRRRRRSSSSSSSSSSSLSSAHPFATFLRSDSSIRPTSSCSHDDHDDKHINKHNNKHSDSAKHNKNKNKNKNSTTAANNTSSISISTSISTSTSTSTSHNQNSTAPDKHPRRTPHTQAVLLLLHSRRLKAHSFNSSHASALEFQYKTQPLAVVDVHKTPCMSTSWA
ncbi:hypothetical protein BD289DRAFT_180599 [Coniella lustricola]|uniref:Uncharacterized protein n=1 Tax=Coniella lustricola TaxID=2025994 RepID=A0A2T2ZTG1_9PEZI|nr:hypothetical protein BD289DRAFT_180599 [Coniella lustricola]